jgi:restriction system protein
MYEQRIEHTGLNQFRVVKANTVEDLRKKVALQHALWLERWAAKCAAQAVREKKVQRQRQQEQRILSVESAKREAEVRTEAVVTQLDVVENLLSSVIERAAKLDWQKLEQKSPFEENPPTPPGPPPSPREPKRGDDRYAVTMSAPVTSKLDFILGRKKKILETFEQDRSLQYAKSELLFEDEHKAWSQELERIGSSHENSLKLHCAALGKWNAKKKAFEGNRSEHNESIKQFHLDYRNRDPLAVQMQTTQVLLESDYPSDFPKEVSTTYLPEAETLVVEYELPSSSCVPTTKEVKYVQVRKQFQDVSLSEAIRKKVYEGVLFQICLRSIYELFVSDEIDGLKTIVFNGWIHSVDRSTGQNNHICILSISVGKDEFLAINLAQVDPKSCFRKLKGIAASKVTDITPVRPVLTLDKEDARFVPAYGVVEHLDERSNLAAMDWLDFENLIREIFEKEFSHNGGEVKITQASRDGGVDAIAYDPDPIRGGKIVIQAKRYTNTVGVSAVRDLYGTVLNEGATKGILVATSEFGSDSYDFAKGKPISLLSGAELLYLLEKHGHKAKIDLAEAKRFFADQKLANT